MQGCKKVVSIQDISGLGRCSLTVVIPVLSAMGIQVCPVPTAVLSAHRLQRVCYERSYRLYEACIGTL